MTKLELYKIKEKQFYEFGESDKYTPKGLSKLMRELENLAVEINKENNCYYDNETWLTRLEFSNKNLTGNELTDYIANEMNKMNGVVLERNIENGKVNYLVEVITPYYVYHYKLYRGYNGVVNLVQDKFPNGSNKTYTRKIIPTNHISELIYEDLSLSDIERLNILKK